jgi:hypothetical protein
MEGMPSFNVVAMLTFTPNSQGILTLPLLMHSTSEGVQGVQLVLFLRELGQDAAGALQQILNLGLGRFGQHVQLALHLAMYVANAGA